MRRWRSAAELAGVYSQPHSRPPRHGNSIMAAVRSDDIRETGYQIGGAVRRHWVLFLTEGIVLIILGALALLAPVMASVAATVVIGLVAGVLLVGWPLLGTLSLTAVLIAFLFAEGVVSIMYALEHRNALSGRWGWMLASGILDVGLGVLLFIGLPGTALWALGLLLGINLIFGGWALIFMALHARPTSTAIAA